MKDKSLSYYKVVILGFAVYFFSYAMRLDYSASLVAIVNDLNVSNTVASAAITGSLITYGIGQILFGFIGDRLSPIKIISFAMLGTILVNVLVSVFSNIFVIAFLWCLNGVFQAMIWPPLCRFVAEHTRSEEYSSAITLVGLSASTGTIFVYLLVPVILNITIWRNVFRCMAILGVIIMLVWMLLTRGLKKVNAATEQAEAKSDLSLLKIIVISGLCPIFLIIISQGFLRDGIQTWLPSMINSEFNLSESSSVLSASVLPILSMISVLISNFIYLRIKNELKTAAIMFTSAAVTTLPLALGAPMPVFLSIFLAALISGAMHGVNHMLIALAPKRFYKYGMMSTFSGILNAFTYVGASLSTYGFAAVSDNFGWGAVRILWCVVGVLGSALCFYKIKGWTKFIKE
ncbi:MAG: MFS transporter [Clostridia bacterium]|nr:MFS transporter [Clostridia bacterium]